MLHQTAAGLRAQREAKHHARQDYSSKTGKVVTSVTIQATLSAHTDGNTALHAIRPNALLLDFGSVISFSVFEILDRAEQRLGFAEGTLTWRGPLDPASDPLWLEMQADRITERNYWERRAQEVGDSLGKAWAPLDFFRAVRGGDLNEDIRPEMVEIVEAAKAAGLKVGILSNELELFGGKESVADIRILRRMDSIVDATHTQILKPDLQAYRLALEALDEPAENVLFVDDQQRNVAGARRAGMRAIHFDITTPEISLARIRAALSLATTDGQSI